MIRYMFDNHRGKIAAATGLVGAGVVAWYLLDQNKRSKHSKKPIENVTEQEMAPVTKPEKSVPAEPKEVQVQAEKKEVESLESKHETVMEQIKQFAADYVLSPSTESKKNRPA